MQSRAKGICTLFALSFVLVIVFTFYEGKQNLATTPSTKVDTAVSANNNNNDNNNNINDVDGNSKRTSTMAAATTPPKDPNEPWVEFISWSPRVFVFHHFLTQEECEEVIRIAGGDITRSLVVAAKGQSSESEWRTSKGVFLTRQYMEKSPLIRDIEKRIADWTQIPVENGEAFYLLRYDHGQQYKPHHDFFSDDETGKQFIGTAGNRFATVLTYLHTPEEGGETHFPTSGNKVKAKAGDAVLFYDMFPSNTPDGSSLHAGLPVVKGVKWAMTKWIREKKILVLERWS